MSFKERTAQFWHKVADFKCQYVIYNEESGFHDCNRTSRHVHHIIPEGTDLSKGNDSEHAIGLPLCEQHHVRNIGDEEYSEDFSFHPDAGYAYRHYHTYKMAVGHFREITGFKDSNVPFQSPFQDMVDEHHRKQAKGERYHAGTPELDEFYIRKMKIKLHRYLLEHPEDRKPDTTPNPRYNPRKKRHWYSNFFDGKDEKD